MAQQDFNALFGLSRRHDDAQRVNLGAEQRHDERDPVGEVTIEGAATDARSFNHEFQRCMCAVFAENPTRRHQQG
jgi:hypothetical protein